MFLAPYVAILQPSDSQHDEGEDAADSNDDSIACARRQNHEPIVGGHCYETAVILRIEKTEQMKGMTKEMEETTYRIILS